ncbi:4-hydroxyphenylacetate 3-monooxygenase reductase component [Pseudomonas fluorescens]|uniref:4-hydroxyphenylacetate 3-monooxygenase reductase component n=1 Tax=Pseudomonas fluorescens TaxID=294 RepID=A0A5E6XIC0_PSEFL|nr:flavin reductase family protein [Pseudomonas fluorescens]VVN41083.1 4-hydroxyphenylacetate 3-monooxygenase reductase component [Pseudomonas fluorescens]VVO94031.1 4-hydroxyphenylacetate 3-monooxygenase reductase component [Pseudomonas fluorescens]
MELMSAGRVEVLSVESELATRSEAAQAYCNAMAKLVVGVCVVTTGDEDGIAGCTATAICSVSDTPPTMLVCINRLSDTSSTAVRSRSMCINILSAHQQGISETFSRRADAGKFSSVEWHRGTSGAPILGGALISLDCEVSTVQDCNTHTIFFCRPLSIVSGEATDPLCYYGRAYQQLA